jgi:Arm DNA-binding domain
MSIRPEQNRDRSILRRPQRRTPGPLPSFANIPNPKPRDKPYRVSDFDGLFLLVKPTGSRLWFQKHRIDGKEKRLAIGSYPEVSLALARLARDAAEQAEHTCRNKFNRSILY